MFTDPLVLGAPCEPVDSTPAVGFTLPLINDKTSGNTLRRVIIGVSRYDFSSLITETRENKPQGTKRLNVRFQVSQPGPDDIIAATFAQFTLGVPNSSADLEDAVSVAQALLFFLLYGDGTSGASLAKGAANLLRLSAGEV